MVTLIGLPVVLAVTTVRMLGLGLVYRIGLLRLGVAAFPLIVTVIAAASVSVAIAVVVSVGLTVAAVPLFTLTVLLILHLLLHFLFSLGACLVEVFSALPAGITVGEHVLDEELHAVADEILRSFVLGVLEIVKAVEDLLEVGNFILFLGALDIIIEH